MNITPVIFSEFQVVLVEVLHARYRMQPDSSKHENAANTLMEASLESLSRLKYITLRDPSLHSGNFV